MSNFEFLVLCQLISVKFYKALISISQSEVIAICRARSGLTVLFNNSPQISLVFIKNLNVFNYFSFLFMEFAFFFYLFYGSEKLFHTFICYFLLMIKSLSWRLIKFQPSLLFRPTYIYIYYILKWVFILYTQMGRNYILKWVVFVQTILADRYIHRRELRLVSLESSSSVEYGIHKIFLIFVFYRELSRFKLLRKVE